VPARIEFQGTSRECKTTVEPLKPFLLLDGPLLKNSGRHEAVVLIYRDEALKRAEGAERYSPLSLYDEKTATRNVRLSAATTMKLAKYAVTPQNHGERQKT